MPRELTVNERLQRLEDRQQEIINLLNGGGNVDFDRSVRGRIHYLVSAERARELRSHDVVRRFTRTQIYVGIAIAVYVALLNTLSLIVVIGGW